ncbi:MAG: protein kinase [Planctomycetes bacterium]|nr:protein kinase [Planctomycetota bacterium]
MTQDPTVSQGALDLRLGMLALSKDLITPDQLRDALAEQAEDPVSGKPLRTLGEILVARGFLDAAALASLDPEPPPTRIDPHEIRREDERLRELLRREGLPREKLDECAAIQFEALARKANDLPRIADLLVERGYATEELIRRVVAVQGSAMLYCPPCGRTYKTANYNPLKEYRCRFCRIFLKPGKGPGRPPTARAVAPPPPSRPARSPSPSTQPATELPASAPSPSDMPRVLGKFRCLRELGRGGMGVVYEALDTQLSRKVALKLMLSSPNADPEEIKLDEERFLSEARLSALLKHPNIVSVYEAGVERGRRYLAMELVEGVSLNVWRKQSSLTIRQQVQLLRDAALAVHEAHERGVLHRDLKPANILVDRKNGPHVTDFGLAKPLGNSSIMSLTSSGMLVGTPTYMSPEQAMCAKSIDRGTDVWALGVMLYEILAGRPPFDGETAIEVLMKVVKNPVPRLAPPGGAENTIQAICMMALAKRPEDRYPKASFLAYDLTRWLRGDRFQAGRKGEETPEISRKRPRR